MVLILDLLIIGIVVLGIFIGYARGFIRTVVSLLGGIVSFFAAKYAAGILAPILADKLPLPGIGSNLTTAVNRSLLESSSINLTGLLTKFGFPAKVAEAVSGHAGKIATDSAGAAITGISSAIDQTLAYCICFVLLFLVFMLIIKLILLALNVFSKLPVLNAVNKVLGGIAGLAGGVFFAWLASIIIAWAGPLLGASLDLNITNDIISRTYIFHYLSGYNPLNFFIG